MTSTGTSCGSMRAAGMAPGASTCSRLRAITGQACRWAALAPATGSAEGRRRLPAARHLQGQPSVSPGRHAPARPARWSPPASSRRSRPSTCVWARRVEPHGGGAASAPRRAVPLLHPAPPATPPATLAAHPPARSSCRTHPAHPAVLILPYASCHAPAHCINQLPSTSAYTQRATHPRPHPPTHLRMPYSSSANPSPLPSLRQAATTGVGIGASEPGAAPPPAGHEQHRQQATPRSSRCSPTAGHTAAPARQPPRLLTCHPLQGPQGRAGVAHLQPVCGSTATEPTTMRSTLILSSSDTGVPYLATPAAG